MTYTSLAYITTRYHNRGYYISPLLCVITTCYNCYITGVIRGKVNLLGYGRSIPPPPMCERGYIW